MVVARKANRRLNTGRGVMNNSKLANLLGAAKIIATKKRNGTIGGPTLRELDINAFDRTAYCRQDPRYAELQTWFDDARKSYNAKDGKTWNGQAAKYREMSLLKKQILASLPFGPITKATKK